VLRQIVVMVVGASLIAGVTGAAGYWILGARQPRRGLVALAMAVLVLVLASGWYSLHLAGLPSYSGARPGVLAEVRELIVVEEAREELLIESWKVAAAIAPVLLVACVILRRGGTNGRERGRKGEPGDGR